MAQVCSDGVRDAGEQCDDGNTDNLDGCDRLCRFEQTHRVNGLILQRGTDGLCAANAFGGSFAANFFGDTAYNQVQSSLAGGVTAGQTNVILHMLGLDDLSGAMDPAFEVGIVGGTPVQPGSTGYNGNNDLDWWYEIDPLSIDAQRVPINRLPASVALNALSAGPGEAELNIILAGGLATFHVSSLNLSVATGAVSTPTTATGDLPPGHLPNENLDPALQSFATAGTTPAPGTMCGNVSALTLAQTPVPLTLQGGVCTQAYTGANSLLDLLISGCNFIGPVIRVTQPDQSDPSEPPAGAGAPYRLSADATTKIVNGCQDAAFQTVPLPACLAAAAYSVHFKFTTDRVMAAPRLDLIFADGFE
jgi:cysteine-rich repeat protein